MKRTMLIIPALAIMMLMTMTGCVYFNLSSTPTPAPTSTPPPINMNFTPPSTENAALLPEIANFADVIAAVRPSVVAITVTVPSLDVFGGILNQEGAGSGWIIDASGLIVTNNHVVEGASNIEVTLENGHSFPAAMVRTDAVSDLAVIKIDAPDLQPAKVADSSKLRVGDWVIAIGNSLGQGISATKGIVSAVNVTLQVSPGQSIYDLIQTDAAINPGNSGGPLVDLLGQVEGITSIKVAEVGVEGTGFAISMKEALPIITDLITSGYAIRPWIGVNLYTVDQVVVLRYRLAVNQGALVTQVVAGSPAEKAGLQAGDVVTEVDGKPVAGVDDLNKIVHGDQIGQVVTLTYYRGSVAGTVTITLEASPPL
jgi:serine protease Do